MSWCVFFIGTNCTGKTTLANSIIRQHGGINIEGKVSYTKDGVIGLCGKYGGKYGGVDGLFEVKILQTLVKEALQKVDIVICEGVKLHSFGLSLQRAIFQAQKQLIVFLYAPAEVIDERLRNRTGSKATGAILKDQRNCLNAVKKWASIGVKVLSFDTSKNSVEQINEKIWHIITAQDGATR